jgi:ATP-dependent helicase/nuclease subunit B
VLDVVFEKYGIPLFMSKRDKITKTAIYKAISSVLEIISDGYRTEDILAYIKSGVCNIDAVDIDLLESYVSLWNINKGRWLDDEDWLMNTRGFTSTVYNDNAEKLKRINALRRKIISPIIELGEDIKNTTASEACIAVYDFIANKSGIAEYYKNTKKSANVTAYNTFIDMLNTLVKIGKDIPVNPQRFSSLLYLMAKNTDYGSIPSTFDRVIAGDAAAIRCNGIKHIFLTDCENGSFPASASEDSFFSDVEKEFLNKYGVKISPIVNDANDEEAFFFLRAACSATETLTATICENKGNIFESIGFQRLKAIFPRNIIINYSANMPEYHKIQSVSTLKSAINSLNNINLSQVTHAYANTFGIEDTENVIPISDPIASITQKEANEIFVKNDSNEEIVQRAIRMSYSSFEAFAKCPFSYFCTYELGLKEKKHSYFMVNDMGSHIHKILEIAIKTLFKNVDIEDGRTVSAITEGEISDTVDKATREVLNKILGQSNSNESKRFEALMNRLKRTIMLVTKNTVDEFKCSKFRPKFYELYIGDGTSDKISLPQLEIATDDGTQINVTGSIDRVDTYLEPKSKDNPADNDKLYVRIIDYKSSVSNHSVKNI